jgi:predicted ferric reductase
MMNKPTNKLDIVSAIIIFAGLPVLFYATGDFPRRTILKESISVLTILGLCLMAGQFFMTRSNNYLPGSYNLGKVIKIHKIIGYSSVSIFLVHPLLFVFPRYFEAGLVPEDCLVAILSTYSNFGVVSGIVAWVLMFILVTTAFFRKYIPLRYKPWTIVHGWLATAFIIFACWHAIDLGRHTNRLLSIYIVVLALSGTLLLLKDYILPTALKSEISQ